MEDEGAIMAFCFQKVYGPEIEQLLRQYYQSLSEKDRRRFAAVEAITLGHGGISYIENILGCSRKTIRTGMQELKQLPNNRDRLTAQLIELTILALILSDSFEAVATSLRWATLTQAAHRDSAPCACPHERPDSSNTSV